MQRSGLVLAGWNTRGFDLPVIVARCLRYGLAVPWYYRQREVRHRYSAEGHLDVMDFLADYGATKPYSLDLAAKLIGMPGKLDCTGASVAKMIAEGRLDEVRAYCLQDVAQTVALFLRTQLLRGELDHDGYVTAMEGLLRAIEREPRLAPMLPLIDLERLLVTRASTHLAVVSRAAPSPAAA
jgi:predicted PolB exonuclease-like 3'-5' exonuclease